MNAEGEQQVFNCAPEESILEAAERANIHVPSGCKSGNCGSCGGTCHDGEYNLDAHNKNALSDEDAANRKILLCVTRPVSDMIIEVEEYSVASLSSRRAVIKEVTEIARNTVRLILILDPDKNGSMLSFEAGQYMELRVPNTSINRAYSLSNISNLEGRAEFIIRLRQGGQFSNWLAKAKAGDVLFAAGPLGGFTLKHNMNERWFVAGGTGLAPILSMLNALADSPDGLPTKLFYGVNTEDELAMLEQINQIGESLSEMNTTLSVMNPSTGWNGHTGSPVDAMKACLSDQVCPDVYVCGPPAMVDAVHALSDRYQLTVYYEKF
jgi:NAD(P)H-flavin reductase/ferredoxin